MQVINYDLKFICYNRIGISILGHGEHNTKVQTGRMLAENEEEQVFSQEGILGDVIVGVQGECTNSNSSLAFFTAGDQITVDELIWEILEGDPRPREDLSEEEASVGETLKGGSPRAIKDDARICLILDCCRCRTILLKG